LLQLFDRVISSGRTHLASLATCRRMNGAGVMYLEFLWVSSPHLILLRISHVANVQVRCGCIF